MNTPEGLIPRSDTGLRSVAEAIPHIVWIAAPDGSVQYFNRRGTDYTGQPAGSVHGGNWVSLVHTEDSERTRRAWEHATRTETAYELECRIRRADGEFRWHACRSLPVRDSEGQVVRWIGTATDIDDQKTLEFDLRRSQRQTAEALSLLEVLHAESPVGFGFVDRDCRIVRINAALAAVYGTPVEERVGRTVAEAVPGLWPQLEAGYRGVLDTCRPVLNVEITGAAVTGRSDIPCWLTSFYPVTVGDDMIGVGFVVVDITERKRTEEALRDGEAKFRRVFENLEDVYVETDMAGTVVEISPLIESYASGRYQREDYIGKSATQFYVDPKRRAQFLAALGERGSVHDFETTFVDLDGVRVPCSLSARLIHGPDGRPVRIVSTMRDITERKHAELSLRAANELFKSLVEQSIMGVYIIQDGRFAYVNERFARMFGYASGSEVAGLDPLLLVADGDRAMVRENMRLRIEGIVPSLNYAFTGLRKDGTPLDVDAHGTRASYRDRPAIVGSLQDISEKKRADDQIRRYLAQLDHAFMRTVEVAMTLGEMRDPYTAGHERRVAGIAVAIGTELGFDARRTDGLQVAGHLHDIGKITVPAEILSKPTTLSSIEYEMIKGHPQAGFDVLKNVGFPWPVAEVALQHHERLDGSGYPQRLKGDAILIEARIMAVADVVEAMSSHRPYRSGLGIEKALAEIERGRGSAFDPMVVDACLRIFREKGYLIPDRS